jgi:hypothetical protein
VFEMTTLLPLRDVSHLRVTPSTDEARIRGRSWLPVSHTELHLACLYFPVAVRLHDGAPHLGLILEPHYLKYPTVDAAGKWRGGYKPIAVRCFPFQPGELGADPLGDIFVASDSCTPADKNGIPLVDGAGNPSAPVREIHRLLHLLRETREKFAEALDQLLIANLLVPLDAPEEPSTNHESPLYTVDGARFLEIDKRALGALARHDFTALDISVACLSSQRLLRPQYRSKIPATPGAKRQAANAAFPSRDALGLEEFNMFLDDGELISIAEIDAIQGQAG